MGNLEELQRELAALCGSVTEVTRSRAQRLLATPLVHSVRRLDDAAELSRSGHLLSRRRRGHHPPQSTPESELELDDVVYLSVGHVYQPGELALIFAPECEHTGAEASPWDTGIFVKRLTCGWTTPERRRVHASYSLPAPQYRHYLVACAAALFFEAAHYITGGPLVREVPSGLSRGYRLARTFEVRVVNRLALAPPSLRAMFVDQTAIAALAPEAVRWIGGLRDRGIAVRPVVTSRRSLERHVEDYLLAELGLAR
jgi:hypothetical protein